MHMCTHRHTFVGTHAHTHTHTHARSLDESLKGIRKRRGGEREREQNKNVMRVDEVRGSLRGSCVCVCVCVCGGVGVVKSVNLERKSRCVTNVHVWEFIIKERNKKGITYLF